MKHRIVVLGAGYSGTNAAGRLARRLHPDDFEITVVNGEPDFVERMRLHQVAVGRDYQVLKLVDVFAGTGVRLRIARVTTVDPERRTVAVTDGDGEDQIAYDTLVYALGSAVAVNGIHGVAEHAFDIAVRPSALRLGERLRELSGGARVLVVGGGLTGIEAATELAEARPDLEVALASRTELGDWLAPVARRHLHRALDRLGVTVHECTAIERVEPTRAVAADGTSFPADITVWAAGFTVHPIAAASGLEVSDTGRIVTDPTLRSVSHPEVYAVGDSVHVIAENGRPLPMSCASAGFTSMRAVTAIEGRLTDRRFEAPPLKYIGNTIGLGQRDAVYQSVGPDLRAKWSFTGRKTARFKAFVLWAAAWNVAHTSSGLPKRKRRLATSARTALGVTS
jgi:NADH dehydrogenase FAD-containing subunit